MDFLVYIFRMYPDLIKTMTHGIVFTGIAILFAHASWMCFQAYRHIRAVSFDVIRAETKKESSSDDPLMVLTAKTYYSAHVQHEGSNYPKHFLSDATFQLIENVFHHKYINRITMITNILPPTGLFGTVFGMIMIFLANEDPNSTMNTQGLGVALFTTLIAMATFIVFEVIKKNLITLSEARIDKALSMASRLF
jgi:hypothetical protein